MANMSTSFFSLEMGAYPGLYNISTSYPFESSNHSMKVRNHVYVHYSIVRLDTWESRAFQLTQIGTLVVFATTTHLFRSFRMRQSPIAICYYTALDIF
jgi:hypothetical protein